MSQPTENSKKIYKDLRNLKYKKDTTFVFVLKPSQLNILGQVFRPIFSGNIAEFNESYIVIEKVNIKMTSAPEFVFPTSLTIPLDKIAVYFEYDANKRFPLH